MRALLFLVALALMAAPALAQEGNATDGTNSTGGTPGEGAQGGDGNATEGAEGGAPAAPQPVTFTLVPGNVGGNWVWHLEGQTQVNPPLVVQPGAEVTIIIKQTENSAGVPHNLQVGTEKTAVITNPGDTQTIKLTAPAEAGSLRYVCLIHEASMKGVLQIRTASAGGGGGDAEWEEFDGETVPLGQVAAGAPAECADRPVPAQMQNSYIGGPVPADYVQRCMNPQGDVESGPAPHGADYVIPISWALIGLGVVGVVWAHKFYTP